MKWKNIFSIPKSISTKEAKAHLDSHPTGSYQLVDVRQPEEYEREHLPGANLIPISELISGKGDLEKEKPTLVYCAVGGRSLAAVRWLSSQGHGEIYNIAGGIKAWMNEKAEGPYEQNLDILVKDAEFDDAVTLAFAMENGLGQFYEFLARHAWNENHQKIFQTLAHYEEKHKERLIHHYAETGGGDLKPYSSSDQRELIGEGGVSLGGLKAKGLTDLAQQYEIIGFAMGIETQAFDFYVRLANNSSNPKNKTFFLDMADEEKTHLAYLARELEKYLKGIDSE